MLRFRSSKGRIGQKYDHSVYWNQCTTHLVVPDDRFFLKPVTLTIVIRYSLNFADSQTGTVQPGIILKDLDGDTYAKDSNDEYFEIEDWNFQAVVAFAHKFKKGEKFWDRKFALIPPDNFDVFDYQLPDNVRNNTAWRPNIVCRFELSSIPSTDLSGLGNSKEADVHLTLDVVRPKEGWFRFFRSHMLLYEEEDVDENTLYHEIGHALDEDHIQALLGHDNTCDIEDDRQGRSRCYVTPDYIEEENVMGSGRGLVLANAKPWVQAIGEHTHTDSGHWKVSLNPDLPARLVRKRFNPTDI